MNELNELKNRVQVLEDFIKSLQASHSIPLTIDQAFRARFTTSSFVISTKAESSETRSVNEAGVGTYDVLKPPNGWFEQIVNGTKYFIPAFTD